RYSEMILSKIYFSDRLLHHGLHRGKTNRHARAYCRERRGRNGLLVASPGLASAAGRTHVAPYRATLERIFGRPRPALRRASVAIGAGVVTRGNCYSGARAGVR